MVKSDMENTSLTPEEKLFSGVLLLNAKVVGLALGVIFGLGIFVATNWLIIWCTVASGLAYLSATGRAVGQ